MIFLQQKMSINLTVLNEKTPDWFFINQSGAGF